MLHRMTVDRCDCNWGCPLVMLLVDPLIDHPVVQQAVGIIESDLLHNYEYSQLQKDPMERGQFSNWGKSSGRHCTVTEERKGHSHQELIDQHSLDHMKQTLSVHWFISLWLHFVFP